MSKTIRESKMLEQVRRWRAEAHPQAFGEAVAQRRSRTQEWARRLNLPVWDESTDAGKSKSSVS